MHSATVCFSFTTVGLLKIRSEYTKECSLFLPRIHDLGLSRSVSVYLFWSRCTIRPCLYLFGAYPYPWVLRQPKASN